MASDDKYGCFGCDFKAPTMAEMEDHYFDNHPENLNIPAYVQGLRKKIAALTSATEGETTKPFPESGRGDYYVVQEHDVREAR